MRRFLLLLTTASALVGSTLAASADQYTVAQGQYTLTGSVQGYGPGPSSSFQQGWSIGWNSQTGLGETDFVNSKGTGAGGFSFFNTTPALWNAATKPSAIMTLGGTGTLKPIALDLGILIGAGGTTTLGQMLTQVLASAPLNSPVLTGTPKLAVAPAAGDTSLDLVSAGWVNNLVTQAVNNASSSAAVGSTTDLSPAKITPSGSSTAQTAAAIAALAVAALPATDSGLAAAESKAGTALQPSNVGSSGTNGVAAYSDSRIVGALPASRLGAASGAASLDSNSLVPSAQIPFGTTTGKVADGGSLATVTTTAGTALQPANIGSTGSNGVAAYNDSRITGALAANNSALASAESLASSSIQPSNVGSTGTNGVAAYNDSRITGAAPLLSPVLTGTPKLANTPAANDTSNDIVTAGWVSSLVSASGGHATSVSSGTDISQANITPSGASSSQTAAAIGALAVGAVPSSLVGAASGVASLNSSSLIPSAQIPFGTTTGTVGDGGVLNTVKTTANAALPSASVGAASGAASLDSNKLVPTAQIPFGTTSGKVADGGTLASVSTVANAAVPSSSLGAASGVATLTSGKFVTSSQIPFGTTSGTVADGGTLATTTTTANGATQKANNLSDVANAATALSNLGGLSLTNGGTVSGAVTHSGSVTNTGNTIIGSGTLGAVIKQTGVMTFTSLMCNNTYTSQDTSNVVYTVPQGLPLNCHISIIQGNSGTVTLAGVTGSNAETLNIGPNQTLVTGGQWTGIHFRIIDATNAVVNDGD